MVVKAAHYSVQLTVGTWRVFWSVFVALSFPPFDDSRPPPA